ncbi:BatD family protein [Paraferrimonas haliotis]|nr:BatD family protein [Paraferrimonas haliotis]
MSVNALLTGMARKRGFWVLLAILVWLSLPKAYAAILVSVDSNPAQANQPIVLTVEVDQDMPADAFNSDFLSSQFIVGRTSVRRSTQIINFESKRTTTWQTIIVAPKPGEFNIAPVTIGNQTSKPFTLTIVEPNAEQLTNQPVKINNALTHSRGYVGQVLTYQIELLVGDELQRGAIQPPKADGLSFQQIGDDQDKTEIRQGKRYRVINRNYAVTLDKPGTYELSGAVFNGDIVVNKRNPNTLFSFNESQPVRAQAQPLTLTVQQQPADFNGQWLVADLVTIHQNDEQWPQQVEVGQPINLQWQITAVNSDVNKIPVPKLQLNESVKVYPEKPQRKSAVRNQQVIAQVTLTQAIIPTQAGELTIPAIRLPWYNPRTQQTEYATLAAQQLTVVESEASRPVISAIDTPAPNPPATEVWPWQVACAMLAFGWFITVLVWMSSRKQASKGQARLVTTQVQVNLGQLKRATTSIDLPMSIKLSSQLLSNDESPLTLSQINDLYPEVGQCLQLAQRLAYSGHEQDSQQLSEILGALYTNVAQALQKPKAVPGAKLPALHASDYP